MISALPRPASSSASPSSLLWDARGPEIRALFERWQQHHDDFAREQLIRRFMPLARKLALRYDSANEPLEDLVQVANIGLVLAINRFDAASGNAFTSFAVPTILGELRRHFRDHGWSVHVPRSAQEGALKIEKAMKEVSTATGREATPQLLAEYLEWPLQRVLEGLEARAGHHGVSLNAPVREEDGFGSEELLDTFGSVEDGYAKIDARLTFAEELRRLPWQAREAVQMRFAEDLTQAQIGERLGVSQMQVSRLLRDALKQLREHLDLADSRPRESDVRSV